MTKFIIGNNFTTVEEPAPMVPAIVKFLTITKDSFVQSIDWDEYNSTGRTVMRTKYFPDKVQLFNPVRNQFPTGRLGYVTQWMWDNYIPFDTVDTRVKPEKQFEVRYIGPPSDGSNGKPARPYQLRAADIIESRGGRGILWYATASGKTVTAARIISQFKVNTLYLVPAIELLEQTVDALKGFLNVPVGIIGDGVWRPEAITVASTATLWSRFETEACKELLKSTNLLIGDEVHHIQVKGGRKEKNKSGETQSVNTWYTIAMNCPAYYRVGLTGTPGKDIEQKRALLECAFGRVADRVSARELIDTGVISDVEIHWHNIKYKKTYSDFHTARKEGIFLNEQFNEYIVQIAVAELKMGRSVLMLTDSKAHQGPLLSKLFERQGLDVPFVSGESTKKDRRTAREEFKAGTRRALIGTVYREGVDFPALDTGILCGGGLDEKKPIQFLGRVLRKAEGKTMAHLHDFNFKDGKHLQKHSQKRLSYFVEEELDRIITHKGISI